MGAVNLAEALAWGQTHAGNSAPRQRKGNAFDYASIAFELDSGAAATLVLSHAPYLRKGLAPDIELHGTEASLGVDRLRSTLTLAHSDKDPASIETVADAGFGNRFAQYVFPALRERIAGRPTEHPGMEDGYRAQLFTDAAARSAREGTWVNLGDIAAQADSAPANGGGA